MRPHLPEPSGRELLADWRKLTDAATASLKAVGDHVEAPQPVLVVMRRQLELVQELVAQERRLQQQAAGQLLAPIDAVFDLLETSGATLRKQAEALESAGQALEESARLVKTQADLFERAIAALREPSDRARALAGLEPRARRSSTRNDGRRPKRSAR